MKSVFMCEHCSTMGPPEEISEHEKTCLHNPDAKTCQNCKHFRCLEKEKRDEDYKKMIKKMPNNVLIFGCSTYFSQVEDYKCFLEKTDEHCFNNNYANYAITPIVGCNSFEKRDVLMVWQSSNIMLT